jgi:hypothetical protein
MYLTRYELVVIVETSRPLHDDLICAVARQLLDAEDRIVELEERAKALSDKALHYAQSGSAINLAWIMNLDKIHKQSSAAMPPVLDPQLASEIESR